MMKKLHALFFGLFLITEAVGQSCLPDGIYFSSQAEIDNFTTNYPNCTEIEGLVEIQGSGITNLDSLYRVTSIGGYFDIYSVPDLTDMEGLSALTRIGSGRFGISGTGLVNLNGLENLVTVPGLRIEGNAYLTSLDGLNSLTTAWEGVYIIGNPLLENLNGLESLTNAGAGGQLIINNNESLVSLSGIENIIFDPLYQVEIWIDHNPLLSECEVNSICGFLEVSGIIHVNNNAEGCNSIDEVRSACETSVDEPDPLPGVSLYPNPAKDKIIVENNIGGNSYPDLIILNVNGQKLVHKIIKESRMEITISHLPAGIYIVKIWNDKDVMVCKVVKQ